MDYTDFLVHIQMCLASYNADREFQLNLAGVDTRSKKSNINEDIDEQVRKQMTGQKKGSSPTKQTIKQNVMKF